MPTKAELLNVLDTVDNVMTKISGFAKLPGISIIPYVSSVAGAIDMIHEGYKAGVSVEQYVEDLKNTYASDTPPTDDQVAALDARLEALGAEIDAALPDQPDEGEPE